MRRRPVVAANHRDHCGGCQSCHCGSCGQPIADLVAGCQAKDCRTGEISGAAGLENVLDRAWRVLNLTEDWIFMDARHIVAREVGADPSGDVVLQDARIHGLLEAWGHCYRLMQAMDGRIRKQPLVPVLIVRRSQ